MEETSKDHPARLPAHPAAPIHGITMAGKRPPEPSSPPLSHPRHVLCWTQPGWGSPPRSPNPTQPPLPAHQPHPSAPHPTGVAAPHNPSRRLPTFRLCSRDPNPNLPLRNVRPPPPSLPPREETDPTVPPTWIRTAAVCRRRRATKRRRARKPRRRACSPTTAAMLDAQRRWRSCAAVTRVMTDCGDTKRWVG